MNLPLHTQRLILRPFAERDIAPFQRYRDDPEVARYQGWEMPYTLEQAAAFVAAEAERELRMAGAPLKPGEWRQVAMELKPSGELVGDCAYQYLNQGRRQAEIGVTLAREFQGQGYAFEGLSCLLDALFADPALHRVRANIDPANSASANLCRRLGMRCEGRWIESLWLKGEWASEDWYAILRREWEKK